MVIKGTFSGVERPNHQKASILITLCNQLDKFGGSVSIKSYRKQQQPRPFKGPWREEPRGCEFLIVDTDRGTDHLFPDGWLAHHAL